MLLHLEVVGEVEFRGMAGMELPCLGLLLTSSYSWVDIALRVFNMDSGTYVKHPYTLDFFINDVYAFYHVCAGHDVSHIFQFHPRPFPFPI